MSGVKDGIGLNITVFSYEDSLGIGVVVDREQVDDPWPILSALRPVFASFVTWPTSTPRTHSLFRLMYGLAVVCGSTLNP